MKAVLLAPTPPPMGGIAGWTVRMMNAKLKNGWEVVVVDEKMLGKRDMFGNKAAQKRNLLDEWKRCRNIWTSLKKALQDDEVKVVHSCIPSQTLSMLREYVCACITKKYKRKFIIHFRCTVPNTSKGRLCVFILKKLCRKSDLIITLNEQTNGYLEQITSTPYILIPNFISERELCENKQIRPDLKNAVYVGGVIRSKGAFELLSMAESCPDIHFRLVGTADSEVCAYAAEKGINNVAFVGPVDKETVKQELENADVFIFLTYFGGEGFSNALCEAMAAGLPCLVTDWAANKDMIENRGGFAVPIRDCDAAVQALERMRPYQVRKVQSEFNRKKVKKRYIERIVIDQYVDAYESLLGV